MAKNYITRNSLDAATLPYNMTQQEYDEYSKEWEDWSSKQGSWGYTPANPILDPQAEDKTATQPSLYQMATQSIQNNS